MKFTQIPKNIAYMFVSLFFGNAADRVVFPIMALVFFDWQSNLLPMDASYTIRSYWYGICVGLPSLGNFIACPVLSCISDRFGRKKLLALSYLGSMIAGVVTSYAILKQDIIVFAVGVFIQGLFSRTNPIGQAAIGDTSPSEEKLAGIGWIQSAIASGAFIGPIIGGYYAQWHFETFNFATPFFLSATFSLMALIVCLSLFKETLKEPAEKLALTHMLGSFRILFKSQTLWLALVLACEQFTWSFYYQYSPPILKLISHYSAQNIGLFVGLMSLWVVLGGSLGITLLRKKFDLTQCLFIGLVMQLLGGELMLISFYAHTPWLSWVSAMPMATGDVIGFSVISTFYLNFYNKQEQGQAMGACFLNAAAIWTVTGFLGGYLITMNKLLPLLLTPISTSAALLVAIWFVGINQQKTQT